MTKPKNTINRLTSASLDLENCIRFLDELDTKIYGTTTYEALLISAIVFYIRPFSENEKRSSTAPSDSRVSEEVLVGLTEEEMKLHEKLKELRNKAIAHAEWGFHPTGISETKIIQAMRFSIWKYFHNTVAISAFRNLTHKVRNAIQNAQANMLHDLT